jgi:hypothetical protein
MQIQLSVEAHIYDKRTLVLVNLGLYNSQARAKDGLHSKRSSLVVTNLSTNQCRPTLSTVKSKRVTELALADTLVTKKLLWLLTNRLHN